MKKSVLYLVSLLFAISLASCGGNETKKESKSNEVKKEVVKTTEFNLASSVKAGEAIYSGKGNCTTCHLATGQGVAGAFPPLAKSDYFKNDMKKVIKIVAKGLNETITVNGTEYKQIMPPVIGLSNEEYRDVVNYVLNSWGNKLGHVTVEDVKEVLK